ncbi:MAG: iron-containing alcohol dehydrogenase [Spirochaetota bacterium]
MEMTIVSPRTVIAHPGALADLSAVPLAGTVLLVAGGRTIVENGVVERASKIIAAKVKKAALYHLPSGEPDTASVDSLAAKARTLSPDAIVVIGGGSAIDTAKAVSVLARNDGSIADYLEGAKEMRKITRPPLPIIAVPTTSGTGAEATKNAVVAIRGENIKRSLRSADIMPATVILDAELTVSMNERTTAITGFDALGQLIESLICRRSNPFIAATALHGITLMGKHFSGACDEPKNIDHRANMQFAAYLSGFCLANSGLGLAHGLASSIGGKYPIVHGLIIGVLLPHVMRYNLQSSESLLARAAEALTGRTFINDLEAAVKGIEAVEALKERHTIPPTLAPFGIATKDIPDIVRASFGGSMSGNPAPVDEESVIQFMEKLI